VRKLVAGCREVGSDHHRRSSSSPSPSPSPLLKPRALGLSLVDLVGLARPSSPLLAEVRSIASPLTVLLDLAHDCPYNYLVSQVFLK
jgi:hypothetical protein